MPTKYKVAVGLLYCVLFVSFASLELGIPATHWALAKFGLYPTLAGMAAYAAIPVGSIWSINKINRDWPTLALPPETIYAPPELVSEDESLAMHSKAESKFVVTSPDGTPPSQARSAARADQLPA